jgi:predicted HTH domain antitoxin
MAIPPHRKDLLWKWILEWVIGDLVKFVFPEADQLFDLKKGFQFLEQELIEVYPQSILQTESRYVDKLVQIYLKDGQEQWVLIHIEVQDSTKAKDRYLFPERMFRYFYKCFDKHRKPLTAIAIFCGPDGRKMENIYRYEFMGTKLQYSFNCLRILDYTEDELTNSENPFAWVMLIAKKALARGKKIDKDLLKGKLLAFRKLLQNKSFGKMKLEAILLFLDKYINIEQAPESLTFTEKINTMHYITEPKNIFELGDSMTLEDVAVKLIRVGRLSIEEIAHATTVPAKIVQAFKEELMKPKKKDEDEYDDIENDEEEDQIGAADIEDTKA